MKEKLLAFWDSVTAAEENKKKSPKEYALDFVESVKRLFGKLDGMTKAFYFGICGLLAFVAPWICGYMTMLSLALKGVYSFGFATKQNIIRYILIGIAPGYGLGKTLCVYFLIFAGLLVVTIIRSPALSPIAETDERGVDYAQKGTYGTAHWMSRKEAEAVYDVGDIKDATGYILGQYTTDGKECISLPINAPGNQNFLVIGSPGKGKTFSFGFNAVLQAMVREESIIIVDPKGELCEKLFTSFEQRGYVVKVYNMVHPERSNAWNFVNEIFDVNTGRMDFSRLTAFVNITMDNTMDGEKEDGFWGPGERNLFQAAVAYAGWQFEQSFEFNLNRTADQWENVELPFVDEQERARLFETIRDKRTNLREKESSLRIIMKASNLISDEEVETCMTEIRMASDPPSIDKVFGMFVRYDIKELEALFDKANIPLSHPAAIAWSMFKKSDDKTKPNLIQGLTQRLKLFANTDIISMSAHDDINFRSLGDRKTAIFCVISDKDSSRKLLTSLFFSFLFRDVSDAADELGPEHRIPVNVMCDEFANIGRIPDFDRFISTVRSRKIYLTIIIQSVAQLAKVYDEHDQETLRECCDTVLFLGCNGEQTAQYISELSGVAYIITSSVRDAKNIMGMRGIGDGYMTSDGAGKRYLINPDEARTLGTEEVLIYHNGQQMLRAKRCGYIHHPIVKAGLPPKAPLALYPKTVDIYGTYNSIFDEYSEVDLAQQKTWNTINARLKNGGAKDEGEPPERPARKESAPKPVPKTAPPPKPAVEAPRQASKPINKATTTQRRNVTNPYAQPQADAKDEQRQPKKPVVNRTSPSAQTTGIANKFSL